MFNSWILAKIFWIVADYVSVDIVSTSETEVSFTIDAWICRKKLDEMSEKIREAVWIQEDNYENSVSYEEGKALVFCIWQNLKHVTWSLWRASTVLGDWKINIEMSSQWKKERAMAFCIDDKDFEKAINLLHDEFINLDSITNCTI
jgi:aspartokinase